jgi:hypothetical protein
MNTSLVTVKQRLFQLFLQVLDAIGEIGLGIVQTLCRSRKAACFCCGYKKTQCLQIHKKQLPSRYIENR